MRVTVIGIGPGHRDQITVQAVKALNAHRVILIPTKAGTTTGETRREIALSHLDDPASHNLVDLPMPKVSERPEGAYAEGVQSFRDAQAQAIHAALDRYCDEEDVALLAWGCPTLYDGTIEGVKTYPGVELTVIPGVTSVSALAAAHGVVQSKVGQSVLITTGRQLAEHIPEGFATIADMVDAKGHLLAHDDDRWQIYWGAYVGHDQQVLRSGNLARVREDIMTTRAELKATHGWLFDIALIQATDANDEAGHPTD